MSSTFVASVASKFIIIAVLLNSGQCMFTVQLTKQNVPVEGNGRAMVHKTAYFGTVHVGFPQTQEFTVVFDTGSAHFFIPSTSCRTETCLLHHRYNRSASSSAIDIDHDGSVVDKNATERDQVSLAYGTGEVVGEFVHEVVCLSAPPPAEVREEDALASDSGNHCAKARVVLAREMTAEPFQKFKFDGVLGLGMEALSLNPAFNFFGQMSRGMRVAPVFGVFLAQSDDESSEISFGGHNSERMASGLHWVPVSSPEHGYWQVKIKRVMVGSQPYALCETGECRAILDSGTSLLGVPKEGLQKLHWQLARKAGSTGVEGDCRQVPGPSLRFELERDGLEVRLDAEDYSRPAPMPVPSKSGGAPTSVCRASLLPVEMPALGPTIFIWGEPVLRRYYTAYDAGSKQIGFAQSRQPAAVSSNMVTV